MMITTLARAGALALTLGLTQVASAVTVFNNGVPDLVAGTGMTEFQVADNFTVSGSFDITNIRFWSAQDTASAYVGSVSWAIFSNAAGLPGASLNSGLATVAGTATGGITGFGYGVYSFDIPVSFTLGAGSYWLALHNGPLTNTTSAGDMTWATSGTGTGPAAVYKDGTWISSGNESAFRIDGNVTVVPEPATTAMLMAGLLAVAGLRLSRRQ
jgi:PEP-CTERM motif